MYLTSLTATAFIAGDRIRKSTDNIVRSVAVLSSGKRIQRAEDDVASLSISTRMSARISSMHSVKRGLAEAATLLQVADDGLKNIEEILQRMKSLSVMAESGSLSTQERHYLNLEFQHLKQEIDHIANATNFNEVYLLNRKSTAPTSSAGGSITGTVSDETQDGTTGNDTIDSAAGNDTANAGEGDDIIRSSGLAPGLQGALYDTGPAIANMAAAQAVIAAAGGTPTATFISTSIDYPNGAVNSATSTVSNFLGVDGATISNPALLPLAANTMVFTYDGYIRVDTPGTYSFSVGSDDGFQLQIDGATAVQFPNNRAFGTTTGNLALGVGYHSFHLLYWESSGQEGLLATSSLTGATPLGQAVLAFGSGEIDGDDSIDGGEGYDIVEFDGNKSDYTLTRIDDVTWQVADNRPLSPNGTDILSNVEVARFADGDVVLNPDYVAPQVRPLISYIISEEGSKMLDIDLLPVTLDEIFEAPDTLNIAQTEDAETAETALDSAIDIVTSRRAYVGSKQVQADIIANVTDLNLQNEDNSRAVLADADIPKESTAYAQATVQRDMSISLMAQANRLRSENVLSVVQNGQNATRQLITGVTV